MSVGQTFFENFAAPLSDAAKAPASRDSVATRDRAPEHAPGQSNDTFARKLASVIEERDTAAPNASSASVSAARTGSRQSGAQIAATDPVLASAAPDAGANDSGAPPVDANGETTLDPATLLPDGAGVPAQPQTQQPSAAPAPGMTPFSGNAAIAPTAPAAGATPDAAGIAPAAGSAIATPDADPASAPASASASAETAPLVPQTSGQNASAAAATDSANIAATTSAPVAVAPLASAVAATATIATAPAQKATASQSSKVVGETASVAAPDIATASDVAAASASAPGARRSDAAHAPQPGVSDTPANSATQSAGANTTATPGSGTTSPSASTNASPALTASTGPAADGTPDAQLPTPTPAADTAATNALASVREAAATTTNTSTNSAHAAMRNAPPAAGQVFARISERFDGRAQRFDVRLDPPELGRVDVRIEIGADKKVHATLAAHDSAALNDLMRGSRALERALAESGIDLADNGLQFELSGDRGNGARGQARDAQLWRQGVLVTMAADVEPDMPVATPHMNDGRYTRLNLVV